MAMAMRAAPVSFYLAECPDIGDSIFYFTACPVAVKKEVMKKLLCIAFVPFLITSCAMDSLTGDTVSRGQAGQAQSVRTGTIISIRNINIQGNSTGGTLVGAGVGGLLGNQFGKGSGQTAATVGGALIGGALGSQAGQSINSRRGIEIDVRLDQNRERISVVQEVNPRENFYVGDKVRVMIGGGRTRVSH